MKAERFEEILNHLQGLKTNKEKIEYLDSVIETTDYDLNGYNEQLIDMRNKLNDLANKNGDNQ